MRIDCGILLAGGRGERLGAPVPKALAVLDGVTLLDRATATLAACCSEVIVVAPADIELGKLAVRRVFDGETGQGPLSGLVAGLAACSGEAVAILGVDFPLVTPALFLALAARHEPGIDAVLTQPGGILQPLVSVMRVSAGARLRNALDAGVRSLHGGLDRLEVCALDDAAIAMLPGGAAALLNVNTPDDLAAARDGLARARAAVS